HHLPGEAAPDAAAIVNPKLDGRGGASDQLTGVGMALKLAQALLEPEADGDWADGLLELAAIGAITDLAPLQGENRYVVHRGLRQLRRTRNAGLLALMRSAGVEQAFADAQDIGYRIGPRLNAAGRLGHADSAYELLMADDAGRAAELAAEMEEQNRRRQQLTEQTLEAALAQIESAGGPGALAVAGDGDFNPGVVGLVAGKLAERYGVPALVYARDGDAARASCRAAASGFHWRDALASIAPLLDRFGGHEQAAGFSCSAERLPEALERLRAVAAERLDGRLGPADGVIDAEASPADLMRGGEFKAMQRMAPFGVGNPAPLFLAQGVEAVRVNTMGADGQHLRLSVRHGGALWDAVAFRQSWAAGVRRAHLVYRLEVDRFRGNERLRLNVEDYAPAG
ncbi:MAG: DHHA1 domain-containing protein, partial [Chloroflexota bacterium]|nr:DHHA1 domain-containing protein [Chloroflexota bacterium]